MISLKVLSTAAAMALVLPMLAPAASFAQQGPHGGKAGFARGGGVRPGGGAAFHGTPGGFRGGAVAGYRGGGYGGGYRRGGGGFVPGAAIAGAVIGGAIASQSYDYYGGPAYAPGYYDDQGYDDGGGVVAVAPAPVGGDGVAYCMQTYRSYDPQSGTYLGFDGLRHPCP
jgi:BA14K-like protein